VDETLAQILNKLFETSQVVKALERENAELKRRLNEATQPNPPTEPNA
jgi:hypothetical protein